MSDVRFKSNGQLEESAYSAAQVSAWLQRLRLPTNYQQYVDKPLAFPKTIEALGALFRCQISTFPYDNLTVHYSNAHLVNIKPDVLYHKMMESTESRGRGGYCMELSIFFHHMIRGLGYNVIMTGVRNRTRTNGVPGGVFQGWTHMTNIIYLPNGTKYSADVAFGGDGPTAPLLMTDDVEAAVHDNLGTQQIRLIHDTIPKQQLTEPRLWIFQYRNGPDKEWNAFYSFSELEFFQEDFEVMNWWAPAHTLHRWTMLVVRFLREGQSLQFAESWGPGQVVEDAEDVRIAGKIMLVTDVVKVNMGGRTQVLCELRTEAERVAAFKKYFGIELSEEEVNAIEDWDMKLTGSA